MQVGKFFNAVLTATAMLIMAPPAQATLQARYLDGVAGIDAWYDTATDLTWLRDVHHADGTFNLTSPSSLTWASGSAWAAGLGSGWRMPSTLDDTGWETTSEMFTLATEGNLTSAYFQGLVTDPAMRPVYWSETMVSFWGPTVHFNFGPTPPANGYSSDSILAFSNTYALAVHAGDVGRAVDIPGSSVPEPESILLVWSALGALALVRRKV